MKGKAQDCLVQVISLRIGGGDEAKSKSNVESRLFQCHRLERCKHYQGGSKVDKTGSGLEIRLPIYSPPRSAINQNNLIITRMQEPIVNIAVCRLDFITFDG
jgi:hypothetical protein